MTRGYPRAGLAAAAWLLIATPLGAQPTIFSEPLSPRIADYAIDVRLDTTNRALTAQEILTWRNRSDDTLGELQFHLYLNGFRNNRSTLFLEGGTWRGHGVAEGDGWGFCEISRIALPSGEDLTERMEFIHPDDDNAEDRTVFRLPLPGPLAPGDSVVLTLDFEAKLPSPPFRTGAKAEYFFVGQWYPKAGVYLDGAWNCHQFHAASEFFADFGVYDVRMTVPENHIVGATGSEVEVVRHGDGTATHYYHAEDVHDFAWASSPEFVVFTADTQDVAIRVLVQPDRVGHAPRHLDATKKAIAYMQGWIGDYPYPSVTVVDPRRGALNSGGMEYPTLFTTIGSYGFPAGFRLPEATTIHEFVHNYWHGMVATNEFDEPWLDEGFTTYSEARITSDLYGPHGDVIDLLGVRIGNWTYNRLPVVDAGGYDRIARRAWEYYSEGVSGVGAYFKPALVLRTLELHVGTETWDRILRTWFERGRFRHPHTREFIDIAEEICGADLDWFFDQALYSNAQLDYSVSRVATKKVPEAKGYGFTLDLSGEEIPGDGEDEEAGDADDSDSGRVIVVETDSAVNPDDDVEDDDEDDGDEEETLYRSEVKVRRQGAFVFPVTVEVVFDDGETVREEWDGRDVWVKFVYTRPAKLVSATVDPDRRIPLDINFTNNSRTVEPKGVGVTKARVRLLFWLQFFMEQPDIANLATLLGGKGME